MLRLESTEAKDRRKIQLVNDKKIGRDERTFLLTANLGLMSELLRLDQGAGPFGFEGAKDQPIQQPMQSSLSVGRYAT